MNSKEIAKQIIDEIESMSGIKLLENEYATAEEVQKWLDATDNDGDAKEISEEIYKII